MQYSSIVRWWPVRSLGLLAKHACSIFKNSSLKFFFIWIWSTSVYLAVFGFWRGHYRPCIGCKGEACTRKLSQRSWCTCDAPKWNEGKNKVRMWYISENHTRNGLFLVWAYLKVTVVFWECYRAAWTPECPPWSHLDWRGPGQMGDKEVHGKVFTIHVLVNLVADSLKKNST